MGLGQFVMASTFSGSMWIRFEELTNDVKLYKNKVIKIICEDIINECLEHSGCIREPKGHNQVSVSTTRVLNSVFHSSPSLILIK